jgi:mannose-1-phosphate guanylyltransferase
MEHVILLSGGSGKRLWPLSNTVSSKQFLRLLKAPDGTNESMMMRAYRGLTETGISDIIIATGEAQASAIRSQLGEPVILSREPCRRDTFPAIALASCLLKKQGANSGDAIVVCPVDAYVEKEYYIAVKNLGITVQEKDCRLMLMGITPAEPSDQFGYIEPETDETVSLVRSFFEKPDPETAVSLIRRGAMWNSGVFAFRLEYILEKARNLLGTDDYDTLYARYADLPKISFDYAVVEHEDQIQAFRFRGVWKDIGTWDSLTEVLAENTIGPASLDAGCSNVSVVNQLDIPLLGMGLTDIVICVAPDGVLVADKKTSVQLKDNAFYPENMPVRYAERSWGSYQVLSRDRNSMTRRIMIQKDKCIETHSHALRNESWTVTSGTGELFLEDRWTKIGPGDAVCIRRGTKHGLKAWEDMILIEVQNGDYLASEDRKVVPDDIGEG